MHKGLVMGVSSDQGVDGHDCARGFIEIRSWKWCQKACTFWNSFWMNKNTEIVSLGFKTLVSRP